MAKGMMKVSGNSKGRESLEFPLEFPPRKRPFLGNSMEFPHRGGSVHTEGVLLHTEGVFWWRLIPR